MSASSRDGAVAEIGPAKGLKKIVPPTATPGAVWTTSLFAIALIALGGIAIRDICVDQKWISGSEWIAAASRWIGRLSWQGWFWAVAIALIVVGLLLLWTAIRPRTKTHIALDGAGTVDGYAPSTWTRKVDVARRASAVARGVAGVTAANTNVKRRKVVTRITTNDEAPADADAVRTAVTAAVTPVLPKHSVKVKTHTVKIPRSQTPPAPSGRPDLPEPIVDTDEDSPEAPSSTAGSTPSTSTTSSTTTKEVRS
ncbi:DUF6286 domain-containing protein [Williamsia deligens]|uniref:DUF6286 domain-containing protein n=1 Tax=Williamsia deligens TaxID=321325 RepID=A0ABW3G7K7_9NOCA|nr:DUF6286 domain-containing protein [Williamsia deligens]MCP2193614.1 hypothetical protein [Williamsia deligens]